MQTSELNCATIEVANNQDTSGRVTADETNRGLRTGKGRKLWRTACLAFLGSLMVAGLFIVLAPMAVRADEDNDIHRGREDNDKGIRAEIAALLARVESLQSTISALQGQVTALQTQLATVKSNRALLLGQFVNVDFAMEKGVRAPNIIFSGANIHIESGSGATGDHGNPTGLGNLIIGYDEDPINPLTGDTTQGLPTIMQSSGFPTPLNPGDRGGSHNLVIGGGNRFTQAAFGGFVAGERNTINSFGASVGGGFFNTASGLFASVSGGIRNFASGLFASVSGGGLNDASGTDASVSGGLENSASDGGASVSGGILNFASILFASVSGGTQNIAGGFATVVIGGANVTDNKDNSIAPQPPFP
jgi:hypothetical protein